MKMNFNYLTNGRMIEGFSYDRGNFDLNHYWARSLLSGAITAGLIFLTTYCVIQMMNPNFAGALGEQAVNFKIAASMLLIGLISYSLLNLFSAIQADILTSLRLARVKRWLVEGWCIHELSEKEIDMKLCKLSMLRCVEQSDGIKVYGVASHSAFEKPFLVELLLKDTAFSATGTVFSERNEVLANITQVCDIWTPTVGKLLGIEVNTPDPLEDQDLSDELHDDVPSFGRARSPIQHNGKSKMATEVVNAG